MKQKYSDPNGGLIGSMHWFMKTNISFGGGPLPVTVANEGLVRDPLLKI